MAQYIDKDALVAEVERRKSQFMSQADDFHSLGMEEKRDHFAVLASNMHSILSFIDNLETKVVDFEKELDRIWFDNKFGDRFDNSAVDFANVREICRHFIELGMAVSNPITAADRGTAEEIIINLKRVEQDYNIDLTMEMEWVRNKVRKGE